MIETASRTSHSGRVCCARG